MKKSNNDWLGRFDAWVAQAKKLRALADERETDFMIFLQEGERLEIHRESPAGYATFGDMLHGEAVCKLHRYETFKKCNERVGADIIRKAGLRQVSKAVLPIPPDAPSRTEPTATAESCVVKALLDFTHRNGTTPSEQQAIAIARKHWEPPPRERQPVDQVQDQIARLKEENKLLKKENARLTRENARLTKELEKYNDRAAE